MNNLPTYEVFAIKYAHRDARRTDNFIGGDPHDAPMPMDYFIWLARNDERLVLIDTGFDTDMAIKRKRTLLRAPRDALRLFGVQPEDVREIVITHMHNDHVGTFSDFPNAVFHLQDEEMEFVTGRHMRHHAFNRAYEIEHVTGMIRLVYKDRVVFHRGDEEIAPGIGVIRVGGHTMGLQAVRVNTKRGWIVLASDASHYYEHFEKARGFTLMFHLGDAVEGYRTMRRYAQSGKHIIPGHDPLVMQRYPAAAPELEGIAVRLDVEPREG